jgi:hypothetical protein
MNVEKHGTIALAELSTVETADLPAKSLKDAGRNVSGDDRIWHSGQAAVPEVDVGATYFRSCRAQQRSTGRKIRPRVLANLDRPLWRRHDGGEDAITHGVR